MNEKYAEYLKEMGTQELADQFLLSENDEVNLFNRLLGFVESNVMPTEEDGLIFAQTQRCLRFYRNYLQQKQQNLLFVGLQEPDQEQQNWLIKQCRNRRDQSGDEQSFENVHDEYVHNQDNALQELLEELKNIRRENKKENLQILLSDVKEAPSALHLINDVHTVPE